MPRSTAPVEVLLSAQVSSQGANMVPSSRHGQIYAVMTTLNQINQPRPHFHGSPVNPLRAETTDSDTRASESDIVTANAYQNYRKYGFGIYFQETVIPGYKNGIMLGATRARVHFLGALVTSPSPMGGS